MKKQVWNRLSFELPEGYANESVLSFSTKEALPKKIQISETTLPRGTSFSEWTRSQLQKRTHSQCYSLDDFDIAGPDENEIETAQISQSHTISGAILTTLEVWICASRVVTQIIVSGDSSNDGALVQTLQNLLDSLELDLERAA